MSLADELLADLEDAGEDEAMPDDLQEAGIAKTDDLADEVDDVSMQTDTSRGSSIHSIAKLRDSKQVG
jgi:hypothetical protein